MLRHTETDNQAEQAAFRGVIVPECLIVGVPVCAIVVRGGVYLVLRFKEVFETGVCNIQRESCVQKFPRAILATLIAISTFATQTWRAIVVPPPNLLKSTSMKCLCLSSRVFFFTLISSRTFPLILVVAEKRGHQLRGEHHYSYITTACV